MTAPDPDVAAELAALLRMRADVHRRLRILTGHDDLRDAVREAHRVVDAAKEADRAARRAAIHTGSGWGQQVESRSLSWRSVWTVASAGLPGLGRDR